MIAWIAAAWLASGLAANLVRHVVVRGSARSKADPGAYHRTMRLGAAAWIVGLATGPFYLGLVATLEVQMRLGARRFDREMAAFRREARVARAVNCTRCGRVVTLMTQLEDPKPRLVFCSMGCAIKAWEEHQAAAERAHFAPVHAWIKRLTGGAS